MWPSEAHSSPGSAGAADLILRLVLYYDIFRHPLTLGELARLSGLDPRFAVSRLEVAGRVERRGNYVCNRGRAGHIEERAARARAAERTWPAARRAGRVLAAFPWVRAALITGGLSKHSAEPGGDVDFLLLVEPGCVWTAKSALQGFRRVLPMRVRECFCTNYLLASDHLGLDDRNMYTAMELATAIPVHGARLCRALIEANPWAERYIPGLAWSRERARHAPTHVRGPIARAVETIMAPASPFIERASLAAWNGYWDRKYAWLDAPTRGQRFKRRPEIATNHLHDFQAYVLSEFARRCELAGVEAP